MRNTGCRSTRPITACVPIRDERSDVQSYIAARAGASPAPTIYGTSLLAHRCRDERSDVQSYIVGAPLAGALNPADALNPAGAVNARVEHLIGAVIELGDALKPAGPLKPTGRLELCGVDYLEPRNPAGAVKTPVEHPTGAGKKTR